MAIDILTKEEIITYRANEHDFLMSIRNGAYLDANNQPTPEFFDMVNEFEKKLADAVKNTSLPEKVDIEKINELRYAANEKIVKENK